MTYCQECSCSTNSCTTMNYWSLVLYTTIIWNFCQHIKNFKLSIINNSKISPTCPLIMNNLSLFILTFKYDPIFKKSLWSLFLRNSNHLVWTKLCFLSDIWPIFLALDLSKAKGILSLYQTKHITWLRHPHY